MKKFFSVILLMVLSFCFIVGSASAATRWTDTGSGKNTSWWIAGNGAGNVNYTINFNELYSYTYRYELNYHEAWAVYYQPYTYSVDVQHANRYYQNGGYLNMVSYNQWGSYKYGVIYGGRYQATGGGNYKGIVGNPGSSTITIKNTGQAYVRNNYGGAYGDSENTYAYLP
jgi:hypothetical protein